MYKVKQKFQLYFSIRVIIIGGPSWETEAVDIFPGIHWREMKPRDFYS